MDGNEADSCACSGLATAAAPGYFKQFIKTETGTSFVDGSIHYKCPAWVAHHERKILWNDVQDRHPDVLVSIGTGLDSAQLTAESESDPPTLCHPSLFRKTMGGVEQAINTLRGIVDDHLDSEKAWNEFYTSVTTLGDGKDTENRLRYIRFDVRFEGKRPTLDEVHEVDSIERQARWSAETNPRIRETAHRLVASSFYFDGEGGCFQEQDNMVVHGGSFIVKSIMASFAYL